MVEVRAAFIQVNLNQISKFPRINNTEKKWITYSEDELAELDF